MSGAKTATPLHDDDGNVTDMRGYNAMFFPESCEIGGYKYYSGYLAQRKGYIEGSDRIDIKRDRNEAYRIASLGNFIGGSVTLVTAKPIDGPKHNADSWLGWFWNVEGGVGIVAGSVFGGLTVGNAQNAWIGGALGVGVSINLPTAGPIGVGILATYYKYLWDDYRRSVVKLKGCNCKAMRAINFLHPPGSASIAKDFVVLKSVKNIYESITK